MSQPKIAPHECQLSSSELRIEKAYAVWRERQDRRDHPAGNFDNKSRWYPAASEQQNAKKPPSDFSGGGVWPGIRR